LLKVYAHAAAESQDVAAGLESLLDGGRPPLRVLPGADLDDEPSDDEREVL
jgi:hypothetical protein